MFLVNICSLAKVDYLFLLHLVSFVFGQLLVTLGRASLPVSLL